MPKHFITGASGFLGSHIVEKLNGMGEEVYAFDILGSESRIQGVSYLQGDILDKDGLLKITEGMDYVHHNAALVPLTKAGKDFYNVNVIGTRNIIECCKKNGIKKLVHMSSSAIYGLPEEMPITDRTEYHPIEIYGQSKLDAEKEVWKYMKDGGRASCIRPRTIVGGKSRLGIFQILFEWISEGRNIYVIGKGSNLFQFVHVDDLISASIKAAFSENCGLYNIGADRYRTLREDLEELISYAKTGSKVKSLPVSLTKSALYMADILRLSPLAPWHYLTYHKPFVFDISKAVKELKWTPKYSNIEALIESYNWYLSNREAIKKESGSTHRKAVKQGILKLIKLLS